MIDNYQDKCDKIGISPVIGVILLVAVTVALVALSTVIVFDLGDDVGESADASVQLDQTDNGVSADILRNENVDEFILRHEDGSEENFEDSIGRIWLNEGTGEYTLIGIVDNNEQVISTHHLSESDISGETLDGEPIEEEFSGTVSYNPPIGDLNIELINTEGDVVDEDTTNKYGEYTLETKGDVEYTINIEGIESKTIDSEEIDEDINLEETTLNNATEESVAELVLNGDGTEENPYRIESMRDLQTAITDLDSYYKLTNDIDASEYKEVIRQSGFEESNSFEVKKGETIELEETPILEIQSINNNGRDLDYSKNKSTGEITIESIVTDTEWNEEKSGVSKGSEVELEKSGVVDIDNINDDNWNDVEFSYDGGNSVTIEEEPEGGVVQITYDYEGEGWVSIDYIYSVEEDVIRGFQPIGNESNQFNGTIDGNGYTISNFKLNYDDESFISDVGLIGYAGESAEIKNLDIENADATTDGDAGILVGKNEGNINNIKVTGEHNTEGWGSIGGVVGNNKGEISNVKSDVIPTGTNTVGGIAGDNTGDISNVEFISNSVEFKESTTGIVVGNNEGKIENINMTTDINVDNSDISNIGGIAGENLGEGKIINSEISGDISAPNTDDVGGVVGINGRAFSDDMPLIKNVKINSNIIGSGERTFNTATISGVGGATGSNHGKIKSTENMGTINGEEIVGGLVGYNYDSKIIESYSDGDVNGEFRVGGLVGTHSGSSNTTESYATGDVTGEDTVGGLIGIHSANKINNTYATGDVTGEDTVGGLIGNMPASNTGDNILSNSYSTGLIDGEESIGGLVGSRNTNTELIDSYWDKDSSNIENSDGGKGLNTEDMQGDDYNSEFEDNIINKDSFIAVIDDYPKLQWQE